MSLSNDSVAVGKVLDDDKGTESGSVYLFRTTDGSPIQKLIADDGADYDYFGHRVSLSNDIVAVGSPGDDDKGTDSGSVYLFRTTESYIVLKRYTEPLRKILSSL